MKSTGAGLPEPFSTHPTPLGGAEGAESTEGKQNDLLLGRPVLVNKCPCGMSETKVKYALMCFCYESFNSTCNVHGSLGIQPLTAPSVQLSTKHSLQQHV